MDGVRLCGAVILKVCKSVYFLLELVESVPHYCRYTVENHDMRLRWRILSQTLQDVFPLLSFCEESSGYDQFLLGIF